MAIFIDASLSQWIMSGFIASISKLMLSILSQEDLQDIIDIAIYFIFIDESMILNYFFDIHVIIKS